MRTDGRQSNELRPVEIIPEYSRYAEGSVMIKFGNTHVLCTASVEESTPKFLHGSGKGWVTAEYGMIPRSTHSRMRRDRTATSGRTQEISRLIGRSLRSGVDLLALGERQITIDCDVIQADGGTRTAATTGGFVALALAVKYLINQGQLKDNPLKSYISAISVGLFKESPLLDLNYDEDSNIETDMNFVMTDSNQFIEIQGTAEGIPFSTQQLNAMIEMAQKGCRELIGMQAKYIGDIIQPKNL